MTKLFKLISGLIALILVATGFVWYSPKVEATGLAIDSSMPSNVGAFSTSPTSPFTFSFNNTAGTLLVCTVVFDNSTTPPTPGAVSYNSVSMGTADKTKSDNNNTRGLIAMWHLLSPATGSHTFSVAWTGSVLQISAGCVSFTGNDTSSPIKQSASAGDTGSASTNPLITLSGVVSGNMSVGSCGSGHGFTAQTQTLSWTKNINNTNFMGNGDITTSASSGSVSHSFTTGSDFWGCVAVEIAAAAATASTDAIFFAGD